MLQNEFKRGRIMVTSRPSFNGVNTAQVRTSRDPSFPPSTMQIAPWLKNIFLMPKPRRGKERRSPILPSSARFLNEGETVFRGASPGSPPRDLPAAARAMTSSAFLPPATTPFLSFPLPPPIRSSVQSVVGDGIADGRTASRRSANAPSLSYLC